MTKKIFAGLSLALCITAVSCKKNGNDVAAKTDGLSDADKALVKAAGFSTYRTSVNSDGTFTLEGDVLATRAELNEWANQKPTNNVIVGGEEHYRTFNVVATPGTQVRTITISLANSNFPTVYASALQNTINRYNNLNLRIRFEQRSPGTSTNIQIRRSNLGGVNAQGFITLGQASGFPSNGNPAPFFTFNSNAAATPFFDTVTEVDDVLSHEVGHLIGFRHTDYLNRQSCGDGSFETAGTIGAVYIPGTPTTGQVSATNNSWMMACSNGTPGFTSADVTALNYVY
jgi:Dual-action HEIGH metallo-peptidase